MSWIIFWLGILIAPPTYAQAPGEVNASDCQPGGTVVRCHLYALSQLARGKHLIQSSEGLLKTNCEAGHGASCFSYASILTERKDREADRFFRLACEKGDTAGCTNLSSVQQGMRGDEQVIKQLRRACDGKMIQGCVNLGMFYEKQQNFEAAEKVYKEICTAQESHGCAAYGQMLQKRGNLERALDVFRTACNAGRKITCFWINAIELKSHPAGADQN